MTGFWGGALFGALVLWWAIGGVAWVIGRHRHRWRVIALSGGSWAKGSFAYRGLLDRCNCGRMRWRPDSPLPAWWPIDDLNRLDGDHLPDLEHLQVWLHAMPRWILRREHGLLELHAV